MQTRVSFLLLRPISKWIARQLAHPHGWFGRTVMLKILNRGNRDLIRAVIDHLALTPDMRVLDVGFGGGLALEYAAKRGVKQLAGVEPSEAAVNFLTARPPSWAMGATLDIHLGTAEHLPFDRGQMDAVMLSTNTLYFMPDLASAFGEMRRVLRPGGVLVLGFSGAEKLRGFDHITANGFCFHTNADIAAAAQDAGFSDVQVTALDGPVTNGDFVLEGR